MAWTDDRVATLSKLWADGLSASQIAAILAEGVTRNAVIGKVHRLGLSGRVKPAGVGGAKPRRKASPRAGTTTRMRTTATARSIGNAALKMDTDVEYEVRLKPAEDVVVPISKKLTLMELTESSCKWPTGGPTRPGFSFCGHKSKEEKPYCEFHSKLAFQPPSERRRRRR